MNEDTWYLDMYGIECTNLKLNKKGKKIGGNIENFLHHITGNHPYLGWGSTGSGGRYFLGLHARLPWNYEGETRDLSKTAVEEEIKKVLKPYAKVKSLLFEIIYEEGWN